MTSRGPTSGSDSAGAGFGFGSSTGAGVSLTLGAGRRVAGLRPRVLRAGVGFGVSTSGDFSAVGAGVSTGFASGVGSGVGVAVATSVTGGSGSSILAPTDDTRFVLRAPDGVVSVTAGV